MGRDDRRADKEFQQISSGASIPDLEGEAKTNEHRRNQAFRDHFEWWAKRMLDSLFIGFIALAGVLVLHLILPAQQGGAGITLWVHGWLTHEQLDDIKGILTGGVIAGLVADHFRRRMGG